MEVVKLKLATACAVLLTATGATLYATGGDWFDYPAKLSDTIDLLPAKSLGEIFLETSTAPAAEGPMDMKTPGTELANRLGKEPLAQSLKAADELVAQARAHYAADHLACNIAHDVHDAVEVSAGNAEAARTYILWRVQHPDLRALSAGGAAAGGAPAPNDLKAVAQKAGSEKGPIKANWLFAIGAATFSEGDRVECDVAFERVMKEFPKHPRAEMAMFLHARCAFSEYRRGFIDRSTEESAESAADKKARQAVAGEFEAFRKRYARGRLDADALGWLGALAYDGKDYLKALDLYIAQAETPGHPETLRTAVYNCEKALAHVASQPAGEAAFALVARHPRIAMAFTYFVISAPEANNYDGKWDNPADVRKWRRNTLPRIAAAVAKQKETYKSGDWQPRYLAMLVFAASSSGNHAQALQLSQIAPEQLNRSDDLLFARAVALQRANKTKESIEALQTLIREFPKSPLVPGSKTRLALALQDDHQAGEAVAVLSQLLPKPKARPTPSPTPPAADASKAGEEGSEEAEPARTDDDEYAYDSRYNEGNNYPQGEDEWKTTESSVFSNITGVVRDEVQQMIDTLLNFAPLPELAAALDNSSLTDIAKRDLRAILAQRYLAAENFSEAKKYAGPAAQAPVDQLSRLTSEAPGTPQQKAERMVKIGDTWAAARGQLLRAPLDTKLHIYARPAKFSGLQRRANGRTLQLASPEDQLDDRDELHHAARWWIRAARSLPGTTLDAQARFKTLEALPQVARSSDYAEQRAREIKLEAVSREIYDKLRSECPNSKEAQQLAAYWSVPAIEGTPPEDPNYLSGEGVAEGTPCDEDACSKGYPLSDDEAFAALTQKRSGSAEKTNWEAFGESVKALRNRAATEEPAELLKDTKNLSAAIRRGVSTLQDAAAANCLDDLTQFLAEPGVTREAAKIYVNIRLDLLHRARFADYDPGISTKEDNDEAVDAEIDEAQTDPALKAFPDYLDFCRMALVSGAPVNVDMDVKDPKAPEQPLTYLSRDFPALEKMSRGFLAKYPKSHKREAAMFVHARAVYSLSCPYIACIGVPAPGTDPADDVQNIVQKSYRREPFQAERVMKGLDDYDHAYPNGRYAADVQNLRAATFWRMGEWDKALRITMAEVLDTTKGDIQNEASVRLASIFAELGNAQHRSQIMAAVTANPASAEYLQAYVGAASRNRNHPLRYLQKFLADRFQFKLPAPENAVTASGDR